MNFRNVNKQVLVSVFAYSRGEDEALVVLSSDELGSLDPAGELQEIIATFCSSGWGLRNLISSQTQTVGLDGSILTNFGELKRLRLLYCLKQWSLDEFPLAFESVGIFERLSDECYSRIVADDGVHPRVLDELLLEYSKRLSQT